MGDEDERHAMSLAQVEHQAQDARPDRDIEHRDRFVRDDDLGIQHHRGRDRHALALAARELVGIALQIGRRRSQSGFLESPLHAR